MAVTTISARDWKIYCGSIEILGLKTLSFSEESKEEECTTFSSQGNLEHKIMDRGLTIKVEGLYLEDPNGGSRDPGQLAVEVLAGKVGEDSRGTFKLVSPGGDERNFKATAKMSDCGGGESELTKWGAEIKKSGAYL